MTMLFFDHFAVKIRTSSILLFMKFHTLLKFVTLLSNTDRSIKEQVFFADSELLTIVFDIFEQVPQFVLMLE